MHPFNSLTHSSCLKCAFHISSMTNMVISTFATLVLAHVLLFCGCRLGDNTSADIIEYAVLVSSCDELQPKLKCTVWTDQIYFENRSSLLHSFAYPIVYQIWFNLSEGYFYYFRVIPRNILGFSQYPAIVLGQYGVIHGLPEFDMVSMAGSSVAVAKDKYEVWQNGNVSSLVTLRILNIPVVQRGVGMQVRFTVDKIENWTLTIFVNVTSTDLRSGTVLMIEPPKLPFWIFPNCMQITVTVTVFFLTPSWQTSNLQYPLSYFCYPDPILKTMTPSFGSLNGNIILTLSISDPSGPLTRQGAQLPNFQDVFYGKQMLSIKFKALSKNYTAPAQIMGVSSVSDSSQTFKIRVLTPRVAEPDLTEIVFLIDNQPISLNTMLVPSTFEFIGSKILEITPVSGLLNPGSDGADLTIKISNVIITETNITLYVGGQFCPLLSPVQTTSQSAVGIEVTLRCKAHELPLSQNGSVKVIAFLQNNVTSKLQGTWIYSLPPLPSIDMSSVIIEGRVGIPSWLAYSSASKVSFLLRNVALAFGRRFQNVTLDGAVVGQVQSLMAGQDIWLSFTVLSTGPIRASVPIFVTVETEIDFGVFSRMNLLAFSVEIRDVSQPQIIAVAPREVPSGQDSVFVLGIASAVEILNRKTALACNLTWFAERTSVTIYGAISYEEWLTGDGQIQTYFPDPQIVSLMVGINENLALQFQTALDAFSETGLHSAPNSTAIVVGKIAKIDSLNTSQLSVAATILLAFGSYKLPALINIARNPVQSAKISAQTENGDLQSSLSGNIKLSARITSFAVVRKASEVVVSFNGIAAIVQRLVQSDSNVTVLDIIVPPSPSSGIITVQIAATSQPDNIGRFSFEYINDLVPVIASFSPYQVYAYPAGTVIQAQLINFPNVTLASVFVKMQVSNTLFPDISPESCVYTDGIALLKFLTPLSSVSGQGIFSIYISSSAQTALPARFEMVFPPATRAVVSRVVPTEGLSSGGEQIIVVLTNLKIVSDGDVIQANFSLLSGWKIQNCTIVATSIMQTTISLISPQFRFGGLSTVEIWQLGREQMSTTFQFFYNNLHFPVVKYVYPSSGFVGKNLAVELLVSMFKPEQDPAKYKVIAPGIQNSSVVAVKVGNDNDVFISLALFCSYASSSPENITIENCADYDTSDACPIFSFNFLFLKYGDPLIQYFYPISVPTDGRYPISVDMSNLPKGLTAADLKLQIADLNGKVLQNVSIVTLAYNTLGATFSDINIIILAPESIGRVPVEKLILTLMWFDPLLSLPGKAVFPSTFSYTKPPDILIRSMVPAKARTSILSFVSLSIANFPGIEVLSDIVVYFSNASTRYSAAVLSYSRSDPSLFHLAIQDVDLVISTPADSGVSQGFWRLVVYHTNYYERVGFMDGFLFEEKLSPVIQGMTSETGQTGTNTLAVRKSVKTLVTTVIGGVSTLLNGCIIGNSVINLVQSYFDGTSNLATGTFYAPPSRCQDPCPAVYGLLLFSGDCSICSSTDCCMTASCSKSCGESCISACFSLTYFNDLLPIITFQSDFQGPSFGGTVIKMKLANFPVVKSGFDVVALFLNTKIQGSVYLMSSTEQSTDLTVVAPAVDLRGENSVSFTQNLVFAVSRPDLFVPFTFSFQQAVPSILSVSPSSGIRTGNIFVTVSIASFSFPAEVGVNFGSLSLSQSSIIVLPNSNSLLTVITFMTPAFSISSVVNCKIFPKSCPLSCGQSVSFDFNLIDPIQILSPFPGIRRSLAETGSQIAVRLINFPRSAEVTVQFVINAGILAVSQRVQSVSTFANITTLKLISPTQVGIYKCILRINSRSGNSSVQFDYEVFDGNQIHIVSLQPTQALTDLTLYGYGQIVKPRTLVSLTVANFPRGSTANTIFISFGLGLYADIQSLQEVTCPANVINCSRTIICFYMPISSVAGNVTGQLYSPLLGPNVKITFTVSYFLPCDFVAFCAGNNMIADSKKILQNPPINSNECDVQYCLDLAKLPDPELIALVPSQGPSSGGTQVTISVRNLPVVTPLALTVNVGSGPQQAIIRPSFFSEEAGSSLTQSTAILKFAMISIPGGDVGRLSTITCTVASLLGPATKQLSFQFQFTPVVLGTAVIASVYPSSIQSNFPTPVLWKLQNFPLVTATTAYRIIAELSCVPFNVFRSTGIVSSTYSQTLAIIVVKVNFTGSCNVRIYWEDSGAERAAVYNMLFDSASLPKVESWFPKYGTRGKSMTISVINFDPSLKYGDFHVGLDDSKSSCNITSVSFTGVSSCTTSVCSKFSISFIIPNLPDSGSSRIFNFSIIAASQSTILVLPVVSQYSPVVTAIVPSSVTVTEIQQTNITIFISNGETLCTDPVTIALFGTRRGSVLKSLLQGEGCILTVRAPFILVNSQISCTISNRQDSVEFCKSDSSARLQILPAPLAVEPIDSDCAGGTRVRFTVIGYSLTEVNASDIKVFFGTGVGVDLAILHSISENDSLPVLIFNVSTPAFDTSSKAIRGSVAVRGLIIPFPFLFECFAAPSGALLPTQAGLDGTTVLGSKSTTISLYNFPALKQAKDAEVAFNGLMCDGMFCSVLTFQNLANRVILTVQVPAWSVETVVTVSITFRGVAPQPLGGDPAVSYVRSFRRVSLPFVYKLPVPVIVSARFCKSCNSGPFCIVNSLCAGRASPRSNSFAFSGKGALTVTVDHVPQIPYNDSTGMIRTPAAISLKLGNTYALIRRIIRSEKSRLSFEAQLRGAASELGYMQAQISVQADSRLPFIAVARFSVNIFDDQVTLSCLNSQCEGSSVQGTPFLVSLSNFLLEPADVSESIVIRFGNLAAASVQFVNSTEEFTILLVQPPNYSCAICNFAGGAAVVLIRVLHSADSSEIAATPYTFWSPPSILQATFDPSGTRIIISFDQGTNRAGMEAWDDGCDRLLVGTHLLLGFGARCIWTADDQLDFFPGQHASIIPGSIIAIQPAALLRSSNQLSRATSSTAVVSAPVLVQPPVTLKSIDVIDACSSLEIRASVASPRPLTSCTWTCLNDPAFDNYLSSVTGPTLALAPGTREMQTFDKIYQIAFSALDFLGTSTQTVVVSVFKQSLPAPQVQFDPPLVSITRNQPVFIRGQAVFSSCPVDQGQLRFSWRVIYGPPNFPASSLNVRIPQIFVPANSLAAGATYILGLKVLNAADPSQVSEGQVVIRVGYQLLFATIDGGSNLVVPSSSKFALSAARSFDPDDTASGNTGQLLNFSWQCTVMDDSVMQLCTSIDGSVLKLPARAYFEFSGNMLNPSDTPYVFTVSVAKTGHALATASVPVFVVSDARPVLQMRSQCIRAEFDQRACCVDYTGLSLANVDSRLSFSGLSDIANTTFQWTLLPRNGAINPTVEPLGNSTVNYIIQGAFGVFMPGNRYSVRLLGYCLNYELPGHAEQAIIINSPPIGGNFSACLLITDSDASATCITVGSAIIDVFRLSCPSWTDPEGDSLLEYRFGFYLLAENVSNNSNIIWFDWAADFVKEISFPSGQVKAVAQVKDDCGALSDVLEVALNISSPRTGGGRRLLGAADFWAKARARVAGALQTFRPDNVNQLTSSMAAEITRASTGLMDAVLLRESLIINVLTAFDQVSL